MSVPGAGGLNLTPPSVKYAEQHQRGHGHGHGDSYAETANYLASSDSEDFTIGKAATVTTVTIVGGPFTYTGAAQYAGHGER